MKFVVGDLKLGDTLTGRIEELLPGNELLLNFSGDLLRVHNETKRPLQVGEAVAVVVKAIDPLRFQLMPDRSELRRRGHLDVSV
jgi:hypothetical protein